MAIFSHALLILAAIGGAASVIALAAVLVSDEAWARWKNARRGSRAAFALAVVLAALYGGTKTAGTRVNYPQTDSGTAYLTDNGSSVTNDAVVLNFTRSSLVPDDARLFLDACPLSVTNAADVAANCVTVYSTRFSAISLPLTVAYENATNYVWYAYTDWTPGPVVHTNGVVNVAWLKAKGEMPPSALRVVPLRTEVTAINAETPEERAYRIYAPCSAFEVTVTNGATVGFTFSRLSGHASATVDWGDGTTSTHTSSPASHTYAADGSFVVKISDDISKFQMKDDNTFQAVTAFLRWGDSVTRADYCWENWPKGMFNLKGFIPRWGKSITRVENCYRRCYKLTGPVPPWPKNIANATFVYTDCSGLTGSIPAWNDKITSAYYTYWNCSRLTGAWTDDPAELMPTNITTHGNCVYGASAALRALFYSDWGGTRTKEE